MYLSLWAMSFVILVFENFLTLLIYVNLKQKSNNRFLVLDGSTSHDTCLNGAKEMQSSSVKFFSLLSVAGCLWSIHARAQDSDPQQNAQTTIAEPLEVTVRSSKRKRHDTEESTKAASRTSSEQIKAASAGTLADALRATPGVSVQLTSPGQGTVYIRGLSGRAVMHTVDGIRLNSTIFRAGNNPYLGLVDPLWLSEIEVIRGSSSVIHGSDALAGVVSMHTPLPGYSLGTGMLWRVQSVQSLGTNPVATASSVGLQWRSESFAGQAGLVWRSYGDVVPGGNHSYPNPNSFHSLRRDNQGQLQPSMVSSQKYTGYQQGSGFLNMRWKLPERWELVVRGQHTYLPRLTRYDELVPLFKQDAPTRVESKLEPLQRTMASVTLINKHRGSSLSKTLLTFSWQRLREELFRRDLDENDQGVLEAAKRRVHEQNQADAFTIRGESQWVSANRNLGGVVGAEMVNELVTSSGETITVADHSSKVRASRYPNGSVATQAAIFGQMEYNWTKKIRTHVGARLSMFALNIAAREGEGDDVSPAFQRALLDGSLNAGGSWEFIPGTRWVANAGRGVRAPNVQDFSALGPRAGGRFQLPNKDVQAEHSWSVDTGLKIRVGAFRASTFLFYLRYDDAIALAPASLAGKNQTDNGQDYVKSVNALRVDVVGTESDWNWRLTNLVSFYGSWFSILGTQTNQSASGTPPSTPADRIPPAQGTIGFHWNIVPVWSLDSFVRFRMRQSRLNDPINLEDNRIPEGGTPGYISFHLRSAWRLYKGWKARLAVDNLTDQRILEHGSGFYQPGLNVTLGLDYQSSFIP
jgi:outer membrane receptor protein involved in Fe transport